MSTHHFLGIDLGGTNIKAGVISMEGESLSYVTMPTHAEAGPHVGVETIAQCGRLAVQKSGLSVEQITSVGLATPGTMDIPAGLLLEPPNLPGWNHFPIRAKVEETLQLPTILQNDANAAAYGEWWLGAGRGVHSLVLWTLGTGVGSGIIIGEMILSGEHSHGGECGHLIIEMDGGRLGKSGLFGTLESYASATALVERCWEQLNSHPDSILHEWLNDGESLTPILIGKAAEQDDSFADEIIMETARCLGVGSTNVINVINPNLILIGGAMTFGRNQTPLGRRFLERVQQEVQARSFPLPASKTTIAYATLGSKAGYIGSAGCARREFLLKKNSSSGSQ